MKISYLFALLLFISLTACNPGGTSTKHDEGPLELFLGVTHSGTVSEGGVSYYWVNGTGLGELYTATMMDVWSSVDITLEFCSTTCSTAVCYSGKGGQCSTSIISDGQPLFINVYGGSYQTLSMPKKASLSSQIEQKAGVIGAKYTILIQ